MKRLPWPLMLLAGIYMAVIAGFPLQAMSIYSTDLLEIQSWANKISVLNILVMASCALSLPLILRGSQLMLVPMSVTAILLFWNNWVVGSYGADFSMWTTLGASFSFLLSYGLVLHPNVRLIFKHPNRRWWLQAQRHKVQIPMQMNVIRGLNYDTECFDVSETGLFVPFEENLPDEELRQGDTIDIRLNLGPLRSIRCQAEIVRKAPSKGQYPAGLGVQFTDMERTDRLALRRYLDASY